MQARYTELAEAFVHVLRAASSAGGQLIVFPVTGADDQTSGFLSLGEILAVR